MKPSVSSSPEYHLFEADRTSGTLVFLVDDNDPVQLTFCEKIRVQVIYDNPIHSSDKNDFDTCEQSNLIVIDPFLLNTSAQKLNTSSLVEEHHPEIKSQYNEHSHDVNVSNPNSEQSLLICSSTLGNNACVHEPVKFVEEVIYCEVSHGDQDSFDLNAECEIDKSVSVSTEDDSVCLSVTQDKAQDIKESSFLQSDDILKCGQDHNVKENDNSFNEHRHSHPRRSGRLHQRGKFLSFGRKNKKETRKSQESTTFIAKEDVKGNNKDTKCNNEYLTKTNKKKSKCEKKEKQNLGIDVIYEMQPNQKDVIIPCTSNEESESILTESCIEENLNVKPDTDQEPDEKGMPDDSDEIKSSPSNTKSKKDPRPRKLLLQKDVHCIYCGVTFDTKLDFFNHRRIKGSCFTCEICGKEEPFEALLMVHMQTHKPQKGQLKEEENERSKQLVRKRNKMKCDVCGLIVSSLDSLKIHMMLHTGEYPYKCCVCDNQFFSLSSLRHHLIVHLSSERVHCKQCDMGFATRAELGKHQLTHELKCGLCGETFPNKTSRNCHYRVSHSDEIMKCTECYSLFTTESELQKHMTYHRNSKKEQCPECGLVVAKLKEHMTLHSRKSGEKLFACQQCPMRYMSKAMLDKHLLSHTGERPYACNKCTKRFRNNGMLRKHLLTHTLERPFVCEVCGKRFSVRSNLVTHMKIHSDTRQYPCNYCSQAFNYKNSLKVHLKAKHSNHNQTQYKCPHCAQQFRDKALLASHIFSDHTEMHTEMKALEKDNISHLSSTFSQGQTQLPMEVSSLSFISDNFQALYNGLDSNHPNAMHLNSSLDLPIVETASCYLNKGPMLNAVSITPGSSNFESMARDEVMNLLNKDRSSPYGHPTMIMSMPSSLQLLPSANLDLPPSDSFNNPLSCQTLSPSNELMEASSPLNTKTIDDSPLDEHSQLYPLYHTL